MKAIQLKKTVLDIPFEENGKTVLTLHFDRSDDNRKRFYGLFKEMQGVIDNLSDDASVDEQISIVKRLADGILGDGAFDKMYNLNQSVLIVAQYLFQIAIGIKEELEAEDLKAVEDKYLS